MFSNYVYSVALGMECVTRNGSCYSTPAKSQNEELYLLLTKNRYTSAREHFSDHSVLSK